LESGKLGNPFGGTLFDMPYRAAERLFKLRYFSNYRFVPTADAAKAMAQKCPVPG
jgi:hypothetical protein